MLNLIRSIVRFIIRVATIAYGGYVVIEELGYSYVDELPMAFGIICIAIPALGFAFDAIERKSKERKTKVNKPEIAEAK